MRGLYQDLWLSRYNKSAGEDPPEGLVGDSLKSTHNLRIGILVPAIGENLSGRLVGDSASSGALPTPRRYAGRGVSAALRRGSGVGGLLGGGEESKTPPPRGTPTASSAERGRVGGWDP